MDLNLNITLQKNSFYFGAGNIFSKLLLLAPLLKKERSFLIVVENEKQVSIYKKIAKGLDIKLEILDNLSDFVNLAFNRIGAFIVSKDFFTLSIVDKKDLKFSIKKGNKILPQDLTKNLNELGYNFSEYQNLNTFSIVGDTMTFVDKFGEKIIISFWDDEVDEIFYGKEKLKEYFFGKNLPISLISGEGKKVCETNFLEENFKNIFTIIDNIDYYNEYDKILSKLENFLVFLAIGRDDKNSKNLGFLDLIINTIDDFKNLLLASKQSFIVTKNTKTIKNFLDLNNLENVIVLDTELNNLKSFSFSTGYKEEKKVVICDDNISRIFIKKRIKRNLSQEMDLLMQIKPGDFVVHIDHGIGVFIEIVEKELGGIKREYLTIEYLNNDKLFVPITEVGRLAKYVGVENPKLTALSTKEWEKKLSKANEDVQKIAEELLEIYAKRKLQKGNSFQSKKALENEFFNSFEFVYTDDQLNSIKDIYQDMENDVAMDRLLSGDVGFGKTEVAFAAAFKAMINSKQVVLISPLIVLAYEHYEKALERFVKFPFNIEVLTRFENQTRVKNTLERLKTGKIDFVIGTHRLLSEDVKFRDLGLLIIDEEHKFGVRDKEKIKALKGNIDILSMSATPIPRSLNMALNGLKDVSMLLNPPVGKQAIETIVSQFDDKLIFDAGKREFNRGGQIFFIHNRVETIVGMQAYLEKIFPSKKIIITHGQLPGDSLEKRIIAFKKGEYDILLSTTVIENGIDFQNVNTIFINDANNFGISQIHQLRGRVGRGHQKGYCYLLFKKDKIKEDSAKKLKTIVDYSHLGAGFELAVKDLEIRGGGDILGIRQSGSNVDIGISLFLELLENKVAELKIQNNYNHFNKDKNSEKENNFKRINTIIDLNIEAYLPNDFFTSELDKLNFYRELESVKQLEDLDNIIDSFNEFNNKNNPDTVNSTSTQNLFNLLKLKILASGYKIKSIKKVGINYQIDFEENTSLEELKRFLKVDREVKFGVISVVRLRTLIKNFTNDEKFVEYLLSILFPNSNDKNEIRKVKLRKGKK